MLVVTWNVNSLNARLPRVLEFLAEHEPDVVCLQETKCSAQAFPLGELEQAGYRAVHHSAGRWAGVALLARDVLDISEPHLGLPGEPAAEEARWCEARIAGVRFVSVYVPNGRSPENPEFQRKLEFLDAMASRVGELADRPLLLAGDLNIAPADIDVYDPSAFVDCTHVTPQERSRLEAILDRGMIDAYRKLHPETVQYTWWDYRAGHFHRGFGLRIDLALLTRELEPRLSGCGIDRNYRKGQKPSDHAPLLVELSD